jgi:hypothetical protein
MEEDVLIEMARSFIKGMLVVVSSDDRHGIPTLMLLASAFDTVGMSPMLMLCFDQFRRLHCMGRRSSRVKWRKWI